MSIRFTNNVLLNRASLILAALLALTLVLSSAAKAQAPIIDASIDKSTSIDEVVPPASALSQPLSNSQTYSAGNAPQQRGNGNAESGIGKLYYQLQLLQQEVMQLRGVVEEQSHQLKRVKNQNMERYLDIDKRLLNIASNPGRQSINNNASLSTKSRGSSVEPENSSQVVALEGEKEAYNRAYKLVSSRRFYEAIEAFKQFLIDYPLGKYVPNSYFWMGELYEVVKPQDLEASRQAYMQLLDQYPDHAKVPDAMYKLGKVYYLKDNKRKAREWLERVIAEYGHGKSSSAADKARQFVNANF